MTVTERLRAFIVDELKWSGSPDILTDDYALIENGVVDSLGIFQLVSFVERELGVAVADEELILENFGTLRTISALVEAKLPAETTT